MTFLQMIEMLIKFPRQWRYIFATRRWIKAGSPPSMALKHE